MLRTKTALGRLRMIVRVTRVAPPTRTKIRNVCRHGFLRAKYNCSFESFQRRVEYRGYSRIRTRTAPRKVLCSYA